MMTVKEMLASFRISVLRYLMPFTKWFGGVHLPGSDKLITQDDFHAIKAALKPGMVFLSHTEGAIGSNILQMDFWTHVAIIVDDDNVIEAIGKGVVKTDLEYFVYNKDDIVLLRPLFATPEQMLAAAQWAEEQVGKPYDYEFGSGNDAFYCSELATDAYMIATDSKSPFVRHEIMGIQTVKPQDFRGAKMKWEQVYLSEAARGIPDAQ